MWIEVSGSIHSPEKDYYKLRETITPQDKVVFYAFQMSIGAAELMTGAGD